MQLLACSYHNIWPFVDQTLSVDFRSGSHMIQAPIGSGKSFLFFDGPLFGLYKHRGRPILNKQSKKWKLQVLFELDWQYRLIERSLTPTTKGGESIKTKMREVSNITWTKQENVISRDSSHLDAQIGKTYLTEVQFAHTKEADKSIQDLLPPKELILSRNFLLQESQSVFELAAGERVQVFKHLFGLLGIDEAKDRINEKRKELQTIIQVKSDQTQQTQKLRTHITEIKALIQHIHDHIPVDLQDERSRLTQRWFFADVWLLSETVQVQDFSLWVDDYHPLETIINSLDTSLTQLSIAQWQQTQLATQIQQLSKTQTSLTTSRSSLTQQLAQLDALLQNNDTTKLEQLQQQLSTSQKSLDAIESQIPYDAFVAYGSPVSDASQLQLTIQSLLNTWKQLAESKTHLQSQLENINNQRTLLQEQITQIQTQKQEVSESHTQQNKFECDKIDAPCPYVQLINKNAMWALEKQLDHFATQETQLQKKLKAYDTKNQTALQEQLKTNEQQTEKLKNFLSQIWRKQLQTLADEYTDTQQSHLKLQSDYTTLQQAQQELQTQKDEKLSITTQLGTLDTQLQDIDLQLKQLQTQQQATSQNGDIATQEKTLQSLKTHITQLHRSCESLDVLVTESKQHQLEVKQLTEELVITKELYQIFSKELMIVVLQDFLPTLQEVINSYLSQIVEYQIAFLTPQDDGDQSTQLELDIEILDERWSRSVKSLSWWQKTILKLVWMLAVATLFKSKFLFLDETINNLDTHTIAQVADVLEEFVKSNNISFYVVTHSPQIQQMDIWESVVRIWIE